MMNTDMMIALAASKRTDYMRTAARERLAGEALAVAPRRSLLRTARYSIGAAMIAAGARLQGVAPALPEPPAFVSPLPAGNIGR
jgi:hypothetical protein